MSHIPRLSEQSSWARWGRDALYINLSRALPIGRAFFLAQLQHSNASIEKQLRPPRNNTQTHHARENVVLMSI